MSPPDAAAAAPTLARRCPACAGAGPFAADLRLPGAGPGGQDWQLVLCPGCGARFVEDRRTIDYGGGDSDSGPAWDFYLEQGAGIDVMLEPLAQAEAAAGGATGPSRRLLEIGGGVGFASDYAQLMLGWQAKGYDPSPLGRIGRRLLGLDIELDYFTAATPLPHPYDLVYASEVIEHIAEPASFVETVKRACGPAGLLVLTTPNGEALDETLSPALKIALASPGQHLTLFSARGLEALLRRCGFGEVRVTAAATSLRAVASDGPLPTAGRPLDRDRYLAYLRRRLEAGAGSPRLASGLRYRLFKELVNAGRYAEAAGWFDQLADAAQEQYGLDLRTAAVPPRIVDFRYTVPQPYNLAGLYHKRAVLALNGDGDPALAGRFAAAAAITAADLRLALRDLTLDDGESEELMLHAAWLAADLLPAHDPARAPLLYAALADFAASHGLSEQILAALGARIGDQLARRGHFADLVKLLARMPARGRGPLLALALGEAMAARDWAALLEIGAAAGEDETAAVLLAAMLPIARLRLEFATAPARRFAALAALPLGDHPAAAVKETGVMFTDLVAAGRQEEALLLQAPALVLARRDDLSAMERGSILLAAGILQQQRQAAAAAAALYEEARQAYEAAAAAGHAEGPNYAEQAASRLAALREAAAG